MGKKNFSFCKSRFRFLQLDETLANEINHDIHLANTLFQIKVLRKNIAAVYSGISLFMLALSRIEILGYDKVVRGRTGGQQIGRSKAGLHRG